MRCRFREGGREGGLNRLMMVMAMVVMRPLNQLCLTAEMVSLVAAAAALVESKYADFFPRSNSFEVGMASGAPTLDEAVCVSIRQVVQLAYRLLSAIVRTAPRKMNSLVFRKKVWVKRPQRFCCFSCRIERFKRRCSLSMSAVGAERLPLI